MLKLMISAVSFFFVSPAFANAKVYFMREWQNKKQIFYVDAKSPSNPKPLLADSTWQLYPEVTSSGKTVFLSQGKDSESLAIVSYSLEAKSIEQWTPSGKQYLHAEVSGDEKWLAFSGPLGENAKNQIGIINLEAERAKKPAKEIQKLGFSYKRYQPKVINLPCEGACYFPALSSVGTFVIFQENLEGTGKRLVQYDLEKKERKVLTAQTDIVMSPSLSFDDRTVVYTKKENGGWDIYSLDLLSGVETKLTFSARNYAPSFTAEGDILFSSHSANGYKLFKISKLQLQQPTPVSELFLDIEGDLYAPVATGSVSLSLRSAPDLPDPARSSFAVSASNDAIFVAGGHQGKEHTYPPESFLPNLEMFNLKTRKWKSLAPRPAAAHGYGTAMCGDSLYAFGGFAYSAEHKPSWHSLDSVDEYNTLTNTWTQVAKLPRKRSSNVVAQVGSKVYLIGGWDSTPKFPGDIDGVFHREIDVFDCETKSVTTLPTYLPNPLRRAFTGVVVGKKVFLIGGIGQGGSHFNLLNQVTSFNPQTLQWIEYPKLPFATFAPAAGAIGNHIYVFGGMFKLSDYEYDYVSHIYDFDFSTREWTHSGRYLKEKKGFSQVVTLPGEKLGILGGHTYLSDGSDTPVKTFEILDRKRD